MSGRPAWRNRIRLGLIVDSGPTRVYRPTSTGFRLLKLTWRKQGRRRTVIPQCESFPAGRWPVIGSSSHGAEFEARTHVPRGERRFSLADHRTLAVCL